MAHDQVTHQSEGLLPGVKWASRDATAPMPIDSRCGNGQRPERQDSTVPTSWEGYVQKWVCTEVAVVASVSATLLSAACGGATPGTASPAPAATGAPSSANATADDTRSVAQIELSGDPRAKRDGRYEVAGPADATCAAGTQLVTVSVKEANAADGKISYVFVRGPVAPASGESVVDVEFESNDFGTSYDSTYQSSDGRKGSATVQGNVAGKRVSVTFEATTWDGARLRGTASCTQTT